MNKNPETQVCPKCGNPLRKSGLVSSGNSKYITWKCDGCTYSSTKCLGPNV